MKKSKNNFESDENQMLKSKSLKYKTKNEQLLGNFEDMPKYFQQNNYIRRGYRLNCNTLSKAFKSLFYWHNESVNTCSHLFGAIFFIFLICFTSFFITNFKTQLNNVRQYLYAIEKDYIKLPKIIEDNLFNNLLVNFKKFKYEFEHLKSSINNVYYSSFIALNEIYTKIISNINNISDNLKLFFDSFNRKFILLKENLLDLLQLEDFFLGNKKFQNDINVERSYKLLRTWPLFVFLVSAILCLSFSAIFHLTGIISYNFHRILSRFDYGGVCLLITGSCYPPYYYFFYCEPKYRTFYLTFMSILGLTTFSLCLTNGFNMPEKRVLRGSLFLFFGLSSGIPILHIAFFGNKLKGYNPDTRLIFWYLGGIIYALGAILYLIRYPEKYFPGKFDYFGSSHQLLHFAVLIGVVLHYIACLDAYYSRFNNLCY